MSDAAHQRAGAVDRGGKNPLTGCRRCRYCGSDIPKVSRRRSFCSAECNDEWRWRTDPGYVRAVVERRDRGRCAGCGVDTRRLQAAYELWLHTRAASIAQPGEDRFAAYNRYCNAPANQPEMDAWLAFHGIPAHRAENRWWDADHILPVAEGGGSCDLSNYQTLCLPCHKAKTARQAARAATLRKQPTAPRKTRNDDHCPR